MSSHAFISFRAINPEISCVFVRDVILNAFIVLQNDSCNIVHAVSIWTVTCIHFNTESPSLGFTSNFTGMHKVRQNLVGNPQRVVF